MCVYVSHCYLGIAGQFFSVSRRVISSTCLRSCAATCSWSFTGEAGNTSKSPPGGFHSQLANPYEPSLFTYVPGCLSCGLFWSSASCRFAAHSIHWMIPLKLDGQVVFQRFTSPFSAQSATSMARKSPIQTLCPSSTSFTTHSTR